MPSYCPTNSLFNFGDVAIHHMNNNRDGGAQLSAPESNPNSSLYANLPITVNSIHSYNNQYTGYRGSEANGFGEAFFQYGPNDNDEANPSLAHLDLDLTTNTQGPDGGSDAWINYHGVIAELFPSTGVYDYNFEVAGNMPPGSKARITYLNLPTQIFDPANIRVKAKAVHGN